MWGAVSPTQTGTVAFAARTAATGAGLAAARKLPPRGGVPPKACQRRGRLRHAATGTAQRAAERTGNPAALVTPRIDASLGPIAQLFAQALERSTGLYDQVPSAVVARGVRQLAQGPKDPERFKVLAGSDLFPPDALIPSGEHLAMTSAQVVRPRAILEAWCPSPVHGEVRTLEPRDGGWVLHHDGGETLVDQVILASAMGTTGLVRDLALRGVRGQASWIGSDQPVEAVAWGGYLIPTGQGFLFGATHDRDDAGTEVRTEDHERNLATLGEVRPDLAADLSVADLQGRAAIRATTPDHLPLAGAAGAGLEGLFLLTGMGSRGFALAPLLGEHVAALVLDAPSPLPAPLAEIVDPDRFRRRAARRGHS